MVRSLTGLPKKSGHNQAVPVELTAEQMAIYNAIITSAQGGDVSAESSPASHNPEETRLGSIDKFSRKDGFGICILSPIAAGAGLNMVAASHLVHLERHWNPAKEDRAIDRAYRIWPDTPCDRISARRAHRARPRRRATSEMLSASFLLPAVAITGVMWWCPTGDVAAVSNRQAHHSKQGLAVGNRRHRSIKHGSICRTPRRRRSCWSGNRRRGRRPRLLPRRARGPSGYLPIRRKAGPCSRRR